MLLLLHRFCMNFCRLSSKWLKRNLKFVRHINEYRAQSLFCRALLVICVVWNELHASCITEFILFGMFTSPCISLSLLFDSTAKIVDNIPSNSSLTNTAVSDWIHSEGSIINCVVSFEMKI